jgi:uncharacterized protein YndB with AHSA1/START domain
MRIEFDLHLEAPREAVFAFLADPRNRPRWQSSLVAFEPVDDGPPRAGMRWRETARGAGRFEMAISAYEPPDRWAERLASPRAEGEVDVRFAEEDGGTRLAVTVDVRIRGVARLAAPLVRLLLRREMRRDLARIPALLSEPPGRA